ncbi:hypothetical protein KCU62_g85, partial [Aureobasidium sp. EXF-3399]
MAVTRTLALKLMETQCAIFNTTYNPSALRTGNSVLRQRLRGPSMAAYYPRRVARFADLQKAYPGFETYDDFEEDRIESVAITKSRGKGAPKKKRTAAGTIQEVWQEEEAKAGACKNIHGCMGCKSKEDRALGLYEERRSMEFYPEDIRRWRSSPCTRIQLSTITLNRRIVCCTVLVLQNCSAFVCCCVLSYSARSDLSQETHIKKHENEEPLNSGQETVYHGTLGYQPSLTGNSDRIPSFQIDQPAHTNHVVPPMRNNNTPAKYVHHPSLHQHQSHPFQHWDQICWSHPLKPYTEA